MTDARAVILNRIRKELPAAPGNNPHGADYLRIPRAYQQSRVLPGEAVIALWIERLRDYDADVLEIPSNSGEQGIADAVATVLHRHDNETVLLVPEATPATWLPAGLEVLRNSTAADTSTLTRAQAVFTPCAVAIAETGTLVLSHGSEQGRRAATLLADHHICLVRATQIVETVSEALALLPPTVPLTTISGPSATADIEMIRVRGVHGPRRLTVLLLR